MSSSSSLSNSSPRVAILGGGITGITLATLLERRGVDYQLFEAAPKLGGLCGSETIDGFTADVSGGHIIFSKHKPVLDFIFDALSEVGVQETKRKTGIYYRGRYVRYPFENGLADLPAEDNYACLSGYVHAYMERQAGTPQPENFEGWCKWRFGEGISENFMFPYNRKLWKTDLEEMSTRWVAGRVPDAPVDDVLRAATGVRTEGYQHQSVFWYPLEGGFERIVTAMAERLDAERLHIQTPVSQVTRRADGSGYDVDGEFFDKVISTIPLLELEKILDGIPDDVHAAFDKLDYLSLATVFVAIDAPPTTDRSWVYLPHPETGPFNRITHLSNYSERNAPPGKSSILSEVTYRGELDNGRSFQDGVVKNLADCSLLDPNRVLWTKSWKNKYAYIVFTHDLEPSLEKVRSHLKSVDIDILGRFGNYDYFNSDQCIKAVMDYVADWA